MPRQAPLKKKIEWTEMADNGLSVAEIRSQEKSRPDPRTVRRAIDWVRGQRRRALAREVALKEGLREHWNLLLQKLDLLPSRDFEWTQFDKKPAFALKASKLNGQGWSAMREQSDWKVDLMFESKIEAQLLKEHLPSDPFWPLVTTLKRDLAAALKARLGFAQAVIHKIEESSALQITKDVSEPGLLLGGLAHLDEYLADHAITDSRARLNLSVDEDAVWFENTLVAKSHGITGNSLKSSIEGAVSDVRGGEPWRRLLATAAKIKVTARNLADESAILKLSTVLPGECRSCARYSI